METPDGGILAFADAARWESWLAAHHERKDGIWVKIAKKDSGEESVTMAEALDVALCHGWIDSRRNAYDGNRYLQRYSPRRQNSPWSRINVGKAEALIAAGRMREPGLASVLAARADDRWDAAYQSQRDADRPARSGPKAALSIPSCPRPSATRTTRERRAPPGVVAALGRFHGPLPTRIGRSSRRQLYSWHSGRLTDETVGCDPLKST